MGERGKRSRPHRDYDDDSKNQKRWGSNWEERTNDRGNDELIAYRILCPDGFIGSVIGKNGKVINSIRKETGAKVKVVDPFPGAKDRVITIYSYVKNKDESEVDDEFDDRQPLCSAQDALIKVHEAIANAVASVGDSDRKYNEREECQLLVPASQSANIIGKSGSTIKRLRGKTRSNIKVSAKDPTDPTHSCAMDFDNFLQIIGDSDNVKKALFAVSAIMYKFPSKESIPLDTTVPEVPQIIIPSDLPVYPAGLYPTVDSFLPSRSLSSMLGATPLPELQSYADTGSHRWPVYSSPLPIVSGFTGGGAQSQELIVRVLCPPNTIGRVIGKGGSSIKSVRQTSGARIEVDDARANREECIITVIATEAMDDLKSMAVEAVLLLQGKINDEDEDTVSIRLLVPTKVIGCIIGKNGSIINEIRKRTRADIRISKGEKPRCADSNDELVEVHGEVGSVRDALVQIVLRLRDDVLSKDKEGNRKSGLDIAYPGVADFSAPPPSLSSLPPGPQLSYDLRDDTGSRLPMLSSSSHYGYGSLPPMEDNDYGYVPPYSSKPYGGLPPPSTLEMVVPAHAVGKVMGKGGANVDNIRKISGAAVEISESKSSRGDRVALISGTSEQKRTAENLIQAFIMST